MTIILCGFPASGKTTIGQLLASQLDYAFIDTDRLIENAYYKKTGSNLNCRQIFKQSGHEYFRTLEKETILSLNAEPNSVIAIGGGALSHVEVSIFLKKRGKIFHLKADPRLSYERLSQKELPAYLDPLDPYVSFKKLFELREPVYQSASDHSIDICSMTPHEITREISRLLNSSESEKVLQIF